MCLWDRVGDADAYIVLSGNELLKIIIMPLGHKMLLIDCILNHSMGILKRHTLYFILTA